MRLKRIYIRNNGPIEDFDFEIKHKAEGQGPSPLVIAGGNGAGKTSLLSIVADSFYEFAANYYRDITPRVSGESGRPFFRLLGSLLHRNWSDYSVSILEYEHGGTSYLYREKSGVVPEGFDERLPSELKGAAFGVDGKSAKTFAVPEDVVREALANSSLLFFPSSRSEVPYWLNGASIENIEFDVSLRFQHDLKRPIYVERGLQRLTQWMLSLLLDNRADYRYVDIPNFGVTPVAASVRQPQSGIDQRIWDSLNAVLRVIVSDDKARFVYGHRNSMLQLGFEMRESSPLPLQALSAGQATLLNIFGTLMRYGDLTSSGAIPAEVNAICVIDEIDAHMHVDLQWRALPELISMFPNVQFVVSTHSPFFILGISKLMGDGVVVLNMPSGTPIQAESFSEFEHAMRILRGTSAFNELLLADVSGTDSAKLLVLCEGDTDPQYILAAARALGRQDVVEDVDIECVGKRDENGQILNSGKDALNAALKLFRAKPAVLGRPVLLLYDNDTRKPNEDSPENVFVRTVHTNENNTKVRAGIENLLPETVFTEEFYERTETPKPNGDVHTLMKLRKAALCESVCKQSDPEIFAGFGEVLDVIASVSEAVKSHSESS